MARTSRGLFVVAQYCTSAVVPRAQVASSLALGPFLFAAMPVAPRMTPAERAIARDMHSRGLTPAHIAKQLGRNRSSITRLLAQGGQDPRRGRPQQCRKEFLPGRLACWVTWLRNPDGPENGSECKTRLMH